MTPNISAMDAEIAQQQAAVNQLVNRKKAASAIYANALAQRPAGIPANWLPDFLVSANTASVKAWFDPGFFGPRLDKERP